MKTKYTIGKSLPRPLCKWWLRTRDCKGQIPTDGWIHPAIEFYVPFWAWPLELLHRAFFGNPKLTAIEGIADGKTRMVSLGKISNNVEEFNKSLNSPNARVTYFK